MAPIANFVIALTVDKKEFEQGLKEAKEGLKGFSSAATQIGATLAGAFSFKKLTADWVDQIRNLDQLGQKLGVTAEKIYGLEKVTQAFHGQAGEASSTLERLENIRAKIVQGKTTKLEDIAISGVGTDTILGAKDSFEAFLNIADKWNGLSQKQQFNLADTLGFSPAQMEMLKSGRKGILDVYDGIVKNRKITDDMMKSAKDFDRAWVEATNNISGALDPVANRLTDMTTGFMKFVAEYTGDGTKARDVTKSIADNLGYVLIGLGAVGAAPTLIKLAMIARGFKQMAKSVKSVRVALELIPGSIGVVSDALAMLSKANPWLLGLTALVSIAYGMYKNYQQGKGKSNAELLTGESTAEGQKDFVLGLANGTTSEEEDYATTLEDRIGEIVEVKPQEATTPADVLLTHDEAATTPPDVIPSHAEAKAQVEEKTAPKVSREEPKDKPKPKPEKRVEVKSAPDGSKTMTVNLVLDGRVIDQRVFRIMGDAIKEVKETSRRTTAR